MSLSFVLVGHQIRRFRTALKALAAIGSELLVEGVPERLVLRSINSARSAFLAVTLSAQFFESYNLFASTGLVQAGVLLKHLLAAFRSSRVGSMAFELNPEQATLTVTLKCDNGLLKRYGLDISSSDILQATLDGDDLPVCVVAESAELNRLLGTFQSTLDEITIIAQPEQEPQHSTAAAAAAARRSVQIKSFYDPAKGASSRSLQTSLELNSQTVFKAYSHAGVSASDVTINLKDLKALLGLCLELGADVSLRFDKAGLPLLAVPHLRGAQAVDYTAELILATLQESQIPDDEWTTTDNAGAAAAAAGARDGVELGDAFHANGAAAAAERTETIAPASTFAGRGVAGTAAAGGDVTPQGGLSRPPGIIRFNARQQEQQQQQEPAVAASGGRSAAAGSGGGAGFSGRSGGGAAAGAGSGGGRYSRGSGLSRLQRLEAEEDEDEPGGVAPYSRLTSTMAARSGGASGAAAAAAGMSGGAGSGGGFGGPRSPTVGGYQQHPQQQQQQQQPPADSGYASRSLGEFGPGQQAAGVAARHQGAAAAAGAVRPGGGTDSQADDPEALPGMRQAHQQQQQQGQGQQQQGFGSEQQWAPSDPQQQQQPQQQQPQQQQQQEQVEGGGYEDFDDEEELLASDDQDMQQADGANFGFL
uniref:Uncharacterized protein n=1 Tax=Tetradesmus obliquus TaxID=3088 RepID=A0A383VQ33_TETOB|eukprot:jgi/Sobl393_1/11531/SZX66949.1